MIELVLRTTESSGLVKEQILARLDGGQALPDADPILEYSGLCIDSLRHQAFYQGQEISLTENYEFHTLAYLASQPGRVFTKEQIYQAVWKEEPVDVSSAVFCIIRNIRQKLRKVTKERIYPDCVGSRIQICRCPRGMSPWGFHI